MLNEKTIDNLNKITRNQKLHRNTIKSLISRGLIFEINGQYFLTNDGMIATGRTPDAIPAEVEEARKVQDNLISIMFEKGIPITTRISAELPASITGDKIMQYVYPEYVAEFRTLIMQFS